MDTVVERWGRLAPHVRVVGPADDTPRPAVLIFHGCGGLRPHLPLYAEAAKAQGWRAFIIDSYAPRGYGRLFALSMVCSGAVLRGHERGGDVLAAVHGVSQRPDVDPGRLVVAGWSHGGWSIMEMLSAARRPGGDLGLIDAEGIDLGGVKGAVLVYPYIGAMAPARMRPWRHRPRTLAMISRRDHLTTVANAQRVFAVHSRAGARIETWIAEGTHAFDEPTGAGPMRHDPVLTREAIRRFGDFLRTIQD